MVRAASGARLLGRVERYYDPGGCERVEQRQLRALCGRGRAYALPGFGPQRRPPCTRQRKSAAGPACSQSFFHESRAATPNERPCPDNPSERTKQHTQRAVAGYPEHTLSSTQYERNRGPSAGRDRRGRVRRCRLLRTNTHSIPERAARAKRAFARRFGRDVPFARRNGPLP